MVSVVFVYDEKFAKLQRNTIFIGGTRDKARMLSNDKMGERDNIDALAVLN